MFLPHVKCIAKWTTIVAHVYNPLFCGVMTLFACNMRTKHEKAQTLLWTKLNAFCMKNGFKEVNFVGFMANVQQLIGMRCMLFTMTRKG
jgi:hypothetical protein